MKWGVAIVVLALLLSIIFVDEWRENLFLEEPREKAVEKDNLSGRGPDADGGRKSVKKLLALMRKHENQWYATDDDYGNFPKNRWNVVSAWSLDDVELLCRSEEGHDWSDVLFERWAMESPEKAISFVLSLKIKYADEYRKAQTSLEGGPGEWAVQEVGMILNAALAGWARIDPHAAWQAASDPDGEIVKSEALDGDGYLAPIKIFEYLALKDSAYAFEEFQRHEDPLFRGSMLKGIVHGLPSGTDWAEIMRDVLLTNGSEHRDIMAVMRGGLLGRWMAANPEEAESWFRGDEGIAISRRVEKIIEPGGVPFIDGDGETAPNVEVIEISLASAVRHWAANDMDGATAWLKDRRELVPEILKGENWLDPDRIGARECRDILVSCYSVPEREALLGSYISGEEVSGALDQLIGSHEKAPMRKEIFELKLSDGLAERVFQSLWSQRNWMEDVSAPGGDPDPFGDE
ncbi:MAG: hypothetical protein ABF379_15380 [Akkermansiaceae bacterium]